MAAKVTLICQGGAWDGKEFSFDSPAKCVIGRGDDCQIRIPRGWEYQLVSRHHCELEIDPPHLRVRDLGSRNGTYINGHLIGLRNPEESPEAAKEMVFASYELQDGDVLWIGPVTFEVRLAGVESKKVRKAAGAARPVPEERTAERHGWMMMGI